MPTTSTKYYPAFLDLTGKLCVIIGGGKVAERKINSLLECKAKVRIISPELTDKLNTLKKAKKIEHISRAYKAGDIKGAFLVIAATDSEPENRKIAKNKNVLLNVVDHPELCSFIVPSSIRRGPMTIAISTSGACPALAKTIRQDLQTTYGPAFGKYLASIGTQRTKAVQTMPNPKERERFFKSLGTKKVLAMLKEGKVPTTPTINNDSITNKRKAKKS